MIPSIINNGACPDPLLQVQEDMFLAILRSARSFLIADTTLQLRAVILASRTTHLHHRYAPRKSPPRGHPEPAASASWGDCYL